MIKDEVIYNDINKDVEGKLIFINTYYKAKKVEEKNRLVPIVTEEILKVDDIVVLNGPKHTFEYHISVIIDNVPYGRLIEIQKNKNKKKERKNNGNYRCN